MDKTIESNLTGIPTAPGRFNLGHGCYMDTWLKPNWFQRWMYKICFGITYEKYNVHI